MSDTLDSLLRDLLQWITAGERSYAEVMDAWRTSCPRLPVWEEANERGLVARRCVDGAAMVRITAAGRKFLRQCMVDIAEQEASTNSSPSGLTRGSTWIAGSSPAMTK